MKIVVLFSLLFICHFSFAQNKGEVIVVKDPLIDSLIAKRIQLNKVKPTATNPTGSAIVSS
ncbi:MAG: SPOR domain-containing protein, partial [Flavobacteriales bacterium]